MVAFSGTGSSRRVLEVAEAMMVEGTAPDAPTLAVMLSVLPAARQGSAACKAVEMLCMHALDMRESDPRGLLLGEAPWAGQRARGGGMGAISRRSSMAVSMGPAHTASSSSSSSSSSQSAGSAHADHLARHPIDALRLEGALGCLLATT